MNNISTHSDSVILSCAICTYSLSSDRSVSLVETEEETLENAEEEPGAPE
jgi:hypothetical protein